jgi:tetratricopeptide (TPR) repeat protein
MKAPSVERVAEFAAAARRIVVERANAADVVTQLLSDTPREEWLSLADRPELQNNGALEQLSREIDRALDRHPQDALPLSLLATKVADSLPDDQYPAVVTAQIRAHAWKDRAQALTFNGKQEDALDAILHSEKVLQPFGTVAHDRAIVEITKARILQHFERFDDALILVNSARKTFNQHGDARRTLLCGITEGAIHYRLGQYSLACDVFRRLLTIAKVVGDEVSLASVHNNLACCLLELGETKQANTHFSSALAGCNNAGRHIDGLRTEMSFGRLFVARGKVAEGLLHLTSARNAFLRHGFTQESGLCALDIAIALYATHRDDEAQKMARTAVDELRSAAVNVRMRTALEYLDHKLVAHDAAATAVRHVRDYIVALQSDPSRGFTVATE